MDGITETSANKSGKLARIVFIIFFMVSLGLIVVMLPDLQLISDRYLTTMMDVGRYNSVFSLYFTYMTAFFGIAICAVILGGMSAIIKTTRRNADALKAIAWFCAWGSMASLGVAFATRFTGGKADIDGVQYVFTFPVKVSCFITAILSACFVNKNRKHVVRAAFATVIFALLTVVMLTIFRSADEDTFKYQSGTNYCFVLLVPAVLLSCGEALRHIDWFEAQEHNAERLRTKAAVVGIYAFVLLLAAQSIAFDLNLYSVFALADKEFAERYFLLFGFVSITNMLWLFVYVVPAIVLLALANVIASDVCRGRYNYSLKLKAAAITTIVFGIISIITMAVNMSEINTLNEGWQAINNPDSTASAELRWVVRYFNRFAYSDSLTGLRNTAFITLVPIGRIGAAIAALVILNKAKKADAAAVAAPNKADEQAEEKPNANDIFN